MSRSNENTKFAALPESELVREVYGGEIYEYYALGQYIVAAPGVCGGRPTFKYTRLDVSMILAQLSTGRTIEDVIRSYNLSSLTFEAIREAILLSSQSLAEISSAFATPEPVLA